MLHCILGTHQVGVARAPTTTGDAEAIGNEPVVYGADENCRNLLGEAKQQQDLLKDYFNHIGALAGSEM